MPMRSSPNAAGLKPASAFWMAALCIPFVATSTQAADFLMPRWNLESSITSEAVQEAVRHFQTRAVALGGEEPGDVDGDDQALRILVSEDAKNPAFADLPQPQREESYLIEADAPGRLIVLAATARGAVHAVSDLETRLRINDDGLRLAFPEWGGPGPHRLVESPAIADRGEYLNIGYNLSGITPHEWDDSEWRRYIDRLVLARLNRWYFYLWIDAQSMFPGSKLSQNPGNLHLHERVREAIRYAQRRGLKVTHMISPTVLPHDVWLAHPEWKADISYARDGFACVCPNAPGAWDQMKAVWQSEMEWFHEADAVQIWFYDPGGCWCETNGCKPNQVESLVRIVEEFGAMFQALNPNAAIEYNMWPLKLWEIQLGVTVREKLARRLQATSSKLAAPLTAVGTPEGSPAEIPDLEQSLGMRTGVFLFPTNPEASYVFPTMHLNYLRRTMQTIQRQGVDAAFGHRLEATTRNTGTFLMGQWMWTPELPTEQVVRTYADWQTGNEAAGRRLAEAILLIDETTDRGIQAEAMQRADDLLTDLPTHLPPPCRDDLEHWPATGAALRILGASQAAEESELATFAEEFRRTIESSRRYAPLAPQGERFFRLYRDYLRKGWEKEHF